MARFVPLVGALVISAIVVGGPWWYQHEYERHYRNFHVVHDGVLYRSAQLDVDGLRHIAREYGIRTIIDLRDGTTTSDQAEEQWAIRTGIKHVRIPPRAWSVPEGPIPADIGVAEF